MTPSLVSYITAYKDFYLLISGTYNNRELTILNKNLDVVEEHTFDGISIWEADFHIDEATSKILLSIITTEHFPVGDRTYQGFNTLWYEIVDNGSSFEFRQIDSWPKSDITRIISKVIDGKRHWVCLRELHYINQSSGGRLERTAIGIAETPEVPVIPNFNYKTVQHKYFKTSFDFHIIGSNLYISGICNLAWNNPTILRINQAKKNVEYIELDIPLKKLHHFEGTKLIEIDNKIYSCFWTSSHEYSKKYHFQMFVVEVNGNALSDSHISKAIDADFVHSIVWNKSNKLVFKKVFQEPKSYFAVLNENGEIKELCTIDQGNPLFLDRDESLICLSEHNKLQRITIPV